MRWSELLASLEHSGLGQAIRASGVWIYGAINLLHILGIATLFGAVLVLDLRLLGWPRRLDLASIASVSVPLSIAGFCLAAASGFCMLATNGEDYASNPFLPIKFAAIAAAAINALIASRTAAWKERELGSMRTNPRHRLQLAVFGGISLFFWLSAISAGRLIGYW